MRTTRTWCAHLLCGLLLFGCDDEADGADASSPGIDAGPGRPSRYEATLVPVTAFDASVYISVPHEVSLLDENGNALIPSAVTTSGPQGEVSMELPTKAVSVYVVGVGAVEEASSTYDTVVVSNNWLAGDPLLRVSGRATLDLVIASAGFTVRNDRAALTGAVYWTKNSVRQGPIGCAKLFIDGLSAPDEDQVQRYMANTPLPVPLAVQQRTSRLGRFYFGNIKVGLHSLRASIDDGASFLGRKTFFVGRPRSGAQGPTKAILYQFALDIEADADPTPADCP